MPGYLGGMLPILAGLAALALWPIASLAAEAPPGAETPAAGLFSGHRLFQPLIADPRWPHFSASYQRFQDSDGPEHVGAASFGQLVNLYGAPFGTQGEWAVGVQAAVFAVFDLAAQSKDLVNADYWVGIPFSYRRGDVSALLRLFHQSSHLGDEFLLRHRVDRVNLSYEAIDFKISRDWSEGVRLYGGGGWLIHREPEELDPWLAQVGAEFRWPGTLAGGLLRPVAGVDLQFLDENDWQADLSLRAGVELLGAEKSDYSVQILFEYFSGRNPNGQFYTRDLEYLGLGLHVFF